MGDRGHNSHGPKRGGCWAPFAGAGTRPVQCGLGRGLLPYQAASSSIQPFGIDMGQKLCGVGVPFFWGSWVHIEYKIAWAAAYLHTKWHLDASRRFATIKMGRKLGKGGSAPYLERGAVSPSSTMWNEPRPIPPCNVPS